MSARDEPATGARAGGLQPSLGRRFRGWAAGNRFIAVLVLLIALFAFFSLTQEHFLTERNIKNLLTSVSILWIVSIGLTFVLLTAGFDLSVGSVLALSGIILAAFYNDLGLPAGAAVALTVIAGALLGGGINGFLIGRIGLSFLVVTLGTLILFRGVVNIWSGTETEAVGSELVETIGIGEVAGLPTPIWVMGGTFILALWVLRRTYLGRDIYAVGGNPEAARVSGIRVAWILIAAYAISGACAALAGVIQVGRIGAASPLVGETVLFQAAAAVLLGGTSLSGGIGGVGGTAVGVLFIGVLGNGLAVAGVEAFWQQAITGAILIVAIFLDKVQREGWASLGFGRGRAARRRAEGARGQGERGPT